MDLNRFGHPAAIAQWIQQAQLAQQHQLKDEPSDDDAGPGQKRAPDFPKI
jgi:hypothetical protein